MNRKVDVRKKYTREAKKMDITIVELKELDAYLTLKEIKEVTQPYYMYINGEQKRWTIILHY